jgi:GntR family transcriptional regulator
MPKPGLGFISKRIPLYYQLENLMREKILSGEYRVGDRLPTENDLIHQYGVSRITVRQALTSLAEDGVIERRQGRGTFVVERRIKRRTVDEQMEFHGSLDEVIDGGPPTPVKVLEINRISADAQEAELLGLQPGDLIYRIKRLRTRDGKPHSLIVNFLPSEIGARFTREELSAGSLLKLIETKFNLRLKQARQQITAALADPHLAGLLDLRVGSPLLSIERTSFTEEGRAVEHVHIYFRADIYSLTVQLTRDEDSKKRKAREQRP